MAQYKHLTASFSIYNRRNRFWGESMSSGENLHMLSVMYKHKQIAVGLGMVNPFTDNGKQSALGGYVTMDGPAVYKFAVKTVPKAINELLDEIGWSADDVDVYVLHQANIRIIESVAKRLKQPMDKFPTNLQQCGNISAASVPILLDKVRKDGMIKHEEKIILSGFGAGLTWGACAIEWQ